MKTQKKQPKYIDFSQRLRKSAARAKTSQKGIVSVLNANPKTVKDWFNGVRMPTEKQMGALVSALNADREWLVNGDADSTDINPVDVKQDDAATEDTSDLGANQEQSVEVEPEVNENGGDESVEVAQDSDTAVLDVETLDGNDTDADQDVASSEEPAKVKTKSKVKTSSQDKIKRLEFKIKKIKQNLKDKENAALLVLGNMVIRRAETDVHYAQLLLNDIHENITKKSDKKVLKSLIVNLTDKVESAK